MHDQGTKTKKRKHGKSKRKKKEKKRLDASRLCVRRRSAERRCNWRERGVSSLQVIAERLADDCGRRGASILHVTRENPISSRSVVEPCSCSPKIALRATEKRLLLAAVGRRCRADPATPTPCGVALRLAASRYEPRQRCVGFHHRTHECMYSLDAWGVYKVGVVIGATGRGGS